MKNILRNEFPIFTNDPSLIYLDSASSTQKPSYVITKTSDYISSSYSNIGRGSYPIAEQSDTYYFGCKEKIASLIHCAPEEIFFSYNSSYCINTIAYSLVQSNYIWQWDDIILSIAEHHSNILIWQKLAQQYNFSIQRLGLDNNLEYDLDQLSTMVGSRTKLLSLSLCSNVLWIKNNLNTVRWIIGNSCLFFVDASQAIAHYEVDIKTIDCDFLVFSGHKFLAYTGLGIGYIKHKYIRTLQAPMLWWWAVDSVNMNNFHMKQNIEKFEPWTPNIISIVSLYYALDYRQHIGWYDYRNTQKNILQQYRYSKINSIHHIALPIHNNIHNIGIYTLKLSDNYNSEDILTQLFRKNICIRGWWHCAHPLHQFLGLHSTLRISLYIYNTIEDIDAFFSLIFKN